MKNIYSTLFILAFSFLAKSQSSHYITTYHGLTSDKVNSIVEDPQSNIWVGTAKGLNKVDKWGKVTTISQLNGYKIFDVAYSASTGVWAATDKGLVNYYNNQITVYDSTLAYTVSKVTEVEITNNGTVWSLNDEKLYQVQGGQLAKFTYTLVSNPQYLKVFGISAEANIIFLHINVGSISLLIENGVDRAWYNPFFISIRFGMHEYKNKIYGVGGNKIFVLRNDTMVLVDSINGYFSTEFVGFDPTTGDFILRYSNKLALYNIDNQTFSPHFAQIKYLSQSNRGKLIFKKNKSTLIYATTGGLLYEFYDFNRIQKGLQLGDFNYHFNRIDRFPSHGVIDTFGRNRPLIYYDGFNAMGKMQGNWKSSGIVNLSMTSSDWQLGPVSNNYELPIYHQKYGRVFQVSKDEVDNHKLNYNNSGYVMPDEIRDWPANGNTFAGESFSLAPFVDVNNNGLYEPSLGDYPEVPGDDCLYAIYHEPQSGNQNLGLGLEVHKFAYVFNDGIFEHENTVYLHYSVINRSANNIDSLTFMLMSDLDVGGIYNDRPAIDTVGNSIYTWNNSIEYKSYYSLNPLQAASGITSLDNEIVSHNSNWPANFQEQINQLNGNYYDGSLNWDSTLQKSSPFQYLWSGDSIFHFTDLYINRADAHQVATLESHNLNANEKLCYNFAFSYDIIGDSLKGIKALKQTKLRLDSVSALWQNSNLLSCLMPTLSEYENENSPLSDLKVYPNPAQDRIVIEANYNIEKVAVYNLQGSLVLDENFRSPFVELDLKLKAGVYFLQIFGNNSWKSERLIIVE